MQIKGIQIFDKKNKIVIELPDILEKIPGGDSYYWSILCLDAMGDLGEDRSLTVFEEQINSSEEGLFITWKDLNSLASKFHQIIEILLIGCKNKNFLDRYKNSAVLKEYEIPTEMLKSCEIVIQKIDGWFWEIFSKDEKLIKKLITKFSKTKFLEITF